MRAHPNDLTRRSTRWRGTPWRRSLVAVGLASVLALAAGCTDDKSPSWSGGDGKGGDTGPKLSATITAPAANATDVPTAAEITYTMANATQGAVELKSASGDVVKGAPHPDGKSWVPDKQLEYGTKYTATVTVTGDGGKTATATQTFTTMKEPGNLVRVPRTSATARCLASGCRSWSPSAARFPRTRAPTCSGGCSSGPRRCRRASGTGSAPPRSATGRRVYWKPGTKLFYRAAAGGLPLGDGWFGRADLTIEASVGPAVVMVVDNATKKMTVTRDGKVLRTIPVSLGKKATPSSYGTMLIMEKYRKTVFDTFKELGPKEGYRINIEYAQRLTWGGEFIHSAPWSVKSQGRTNVSHGCVNMSPANAVWLFGITKVGDPVTVKGTERKVQLGNGFTDWNMTWEQYVKGSALPYAPPAAPATEPSATPTPTPTG